MVDGEAVGAEKYPHPCPSPKLGRGVIAIENPWDEEWLKGKEWYKNWWKLHDITKQVMWF